MNNYTVKKSQNHGMVLEKDGIECFCPFQSPLLMPVPSSVGGMGMSIVRMPCGTNCPHAKLIPTVDLKDSSLNYLTYELSCSGELITFKVTESTPPQETKKSPLIAM